ncbi:hypothetical protein chiPu_0021315 [Chiloscyllium punctatum]|uniref:Uncharacterized protein n=1 Tax=Chiloscyllium punctatum TaxID=137246 RepID=A0A401RPV1_CHIPU|nr:hypothetical protein [Chiloscyllium punctatum]
MKARPKAEPRGEIRLSLLAWNCQCRYEQSHSLPSPFGPLPTFEMIINRPEHGVGSALEDETVGRTAGSNPAEGAGLEVSKSA